MTHVLVADDDPDMRDLIALKLERLGFRVTPVGDGRAALDLLAGTPFDLAVLDMRMPRVSGLEVLRILRGEPDRPRLPVLMISAASDASPELHDAGADLFLPKPFSLRPWPRRWQDCWPCATDLWDVGPAGPGPTRLASSPMRRVC